MYTFQCLQTSPGPHFALAFRFQAPKPAPGNLQAGQVVFVDLAGSERVGKSGVSADGTGGARAFSVLDVTRHLLGGGFKYFLFSSPFREMIQFD